MKAYRIERNGLGIFRHLTEEQQLSVEELYGGDMMVQELIHNGEDGYSMLKGDDWNHLAAFFTEEDLRKEVGDALPLFISYGFEIFEYDCEIIEDRFHPWIDTTKPFTKRKIC